MNQQETQVCRKCGKVFPLNNFCKHSSTANRHRKECKACDSVYHKDRLAALKADPTQYEKRQAIIRDKARKMRGIAKGATPEQKKRLCNQWKTRYPEKYAAHIACSNWEKTPGVNVHHWSYNEEHRKDVIRLTTAQHALAHRFMTYDQERMMYRRLDGTLIDTREAAIAYYATLKDDTPTHVETGIK